MAEERGRQLDLTLHIGTLKTGSSSLQAFCRMNRPLLREHGWLYPRSLGRAGHAQMGQWARSDAQLTESFRRRRPGTEAFASPEELRREVPRRLLKEVRRTGFRKLLISDEALSRSPEEGLARLRGFADQHVSSLRVVCYLRRQDDYLVSMYQQAVRLGETRTLAQRALDEDLSHTYDYYGRLRSWLRAVAPDELVVRRFERSSFVNGSLYDDFVDAVGLGIPTSRTPERERNESLDAQCTEFLRLVNLYRSAHPEDREVPPVNRPLVVVLKRLARGPTLTLPGADLDRFMARWQDSNRRVARELIGNPEGELFTSPRKTSGTTVEQWLDPARIGPLVAALDPLPDRLEEPLRRLAEREAVRP